MKFSFTNIQIAGDWRMPVLLTVFMLFSQLSVAQTMIYSTEPLAGKGVLKGATDQPFYILKVVANQGYSFLPLSFNRLVIKTSGTYTSSDITRVKLWRSSTPSMVGATHIATVNAISGAGETLSFTVDQIISAKLNVTVYYLFSADVSPSGGVNKTFGINGADSGIDVFYRSGTSVTDNQTNASELLTIADPGLNPAVTYSTEAVPASDALWGNADHLVYILKIVVGPAAPVTLRSVSLRTGGTYTGSDIDRFEIWRNSTPQKQGSTKWGGDATITGNGETLTLGGTAQTLNPNSTTYYLITVDVSSTTTNKKTIAINGAENFIQIWYNGVTPIVSNSQSNKAGLQTIVAPSVTYSREALAVTNVLLGIPNQLVYVLKMEVGSVFPVTVSALSIKTGGSYTASDISRFRVWQNDTPDTDGATLWGAYNSITGAGETFRLTSPAQTFATNSITYFLVTVDVKPEATKSRTLSFSGGEDFSLVYNNSTPTITNLIAFTLYHTIIDNGITCIPVLMPIGNAAQGAVDHLFYIVKILVGPAAPMKFSGLSIGITGSYNNNDIGKFKIWRNNAPTLEGSTFWAETSSIRQSPQELVIITGSEMTLAANSTTYLLISADVKAGAAIGKTFGINGGNSGLRFPGNTVSNVSSDVAGLQTVVGPLPVTLVSFKAKAEEGVRQLSWETTAELDNDYFGIERSADARNFTEIARLKGTSGGFQTQRYHYTDQETVQTGTMLYYRLKMVDLDGTYTYSAIVTCRDLNPQTLQATVFPNPFSAYVKVNFTPGETVTFSWRSMDGRNLKIPEKRVIPSSGQILLTGLNDLAPGIYVLIINSSAGQIAQKLVRE